MEALVQTQKTYKYYEKSCSGNTITYLHLFRNIIMLEQKIENAKMH